MKRVQKLMLAQVALVVVFASAYVSAHITADSLTADQIAANAITTSGLNADSVPSPPIASQGKS